MNPVAHGSLITWQEEIHPIGALVGVWNWEQNHEYLGVIIKDFWTRSKRKRIPSRRIIHVLVAGKIEALSPHEVFEPGMTTPIIPC